MKKYTEANGHKWRWGSWHCYAHNRRCDPLAPVTADDILTLAAKDEKLEDGAFIEISKALRKGKKR